ncbi:MAG: hypothetical protein ACLPVF_06875 [Acidimicrobiales bacterium]
MLRRAALALTGVVVMIVALAGVSVVSAAPPHESSHASSEALARAEVLPASAYPKGWKGQGSDSNFTDASFFGAATPSDVQLMTDCLAISAKNINTDPVEVAAPSYGNPNGALTVSDSVEVYQNTAQAVADVTAAGNENIPTCVAKLEGANFTQATLEGFGEGSTLSGPLAVTLGHLPPVGSHDAFYAVTIPVTDQGLTGTTYSDFVYVQKGRSESVLSIFDDGPPPAGLIDRLAKAAAGRLHNS